MKVWYDAGVGVGGGLNGGLTTAMLRYKSWLSELDADIGMGGGTEND